MTRLAVLLALCAAPALADGPLCADHAALETRLRDAYGETRRSVALDRAGSMVETWADATDGSWTLTLTKPGQGTCIIGEGWAWEAVKPEPQGELG